MVVRSSLKCQIIILQPRASMHEIHYISISIDVPTAVSKSAWPLKRLANNRNS